MSHSLLLRAVSFDAMNTLITLREPVGVVYSNMASQFNIQADSEQLSNAFRRHFVSMSVEFPCFGFYCCDHKEILSATVETISNTNCLSTSWWRTLVRRCFLDIGVSDGKKLDELACCLVHYYSTKKPWRLTDERVPIILRRLKRKGLQVVIISNFDRHLRDILSEFDLLQSVDFLTLSGELGLEKPDRRIFDMVLDRMQLTEPGQWMHIGDDLDKDYRAAKKIGVRAVLIEGEKKEIDTEDVLKENRVFRLSDIHIY